MHTEDLNQAFSKLDFLLASNTNINGYDFQVLGIPFMHYTSLWLSQSHYHQFYELHYIIDGECDSIVNKVHLSCKPGCFYVIPPGAVHSHNSAAHTGFAMRWRVNEITCCREANMDQHHNIYKYIQRLTSLPNIVVEDKKSFVLNKILDIISNVDNDRRIVTQLAIVGLLLSIPDAFNASSIAADIENITINHESIVEKCLKYIDDNCFSDIGVEDVAAYVHLSYGYVSRVFKTVTGSSLNKEINTARLRKAQYMLITNNDSVSTISAKAGFSSENYFSMAFKKQFELTPSAYRKSHKRLSE